MSLLAAYLGPTMKVTSLPSLDAEDGVLAPFGLGWYPAQGEPPLRTISRAYAAEGSVDLELAQGFSAECAMTSTGAQPDGDAHPFRWGPLLFGYRGRLERYEEVFEAALLSRLSPAARAATRSRSPEAALFMTWLEMLQGNTDTDTLADGLERMVAAVQDLAVTAGAAATFSVVATNGECLVALRTGTDDDLPPLYTLVGSDETAIPTSGRIVTTQQVFPGSWTSLEAHSMVIFTRDQE